MHMHAHACNRMHSHACACKLMQAHAHAWNACECMQLHSTHSIAQKCVLNRYFLNWIFNIHKKFTTARNACAGMYMHAIHALACDTCAYMYPMKRIHRTNRMQTHAKIACIACNACSSFHVQNFRMWAHRMYARACALCTCMRCMHLK